MNLFDLPGPQFLLVFAVLAAAVLVGARWLAAKLEPRGEPALLRDPYAIAYLRAGKRQGAREALRVAALSLIDRGQLVVEDGALRWPRQAPNVRDPIEAIVVRGCAEKCRFPQILSAKNCDAARAHLEQSLQARGLEPEADTSPGRAIVWLLAIGLLWAVAGYKLVLAAERGRSNVGFLWILAITATVLSVPVVLRAGARRADGAVAVARQLFDGVRRRASVLQAGKHPDEVRQLAAVFGVSAVPLAVFPHRELLEVRTTHRKDRATDNAGGWGGGGCGSATSCGGSSSSCGSGCGGGGGCGGCGS